MAPATRFDQWKRNGTFERMNVALNQMDRQRAGKEVPPSVVCIDSQSVKLTPIIWDERGLDANNRVNGRKRQLIVDTQGRLWVSGVHAAYQADGAGVVELISNLLWRVSERLEKVYGDQAYNGVFARALNSLSKSIIQNL